MLELLSRMFGNPLLRILQSNPDDLLNVIYTLKLPYSEGRRDTALTRNRILAL